MECCFIHSKLSAFGAPQRVIFTSLWKESLNSDGQQLHQYQQNQQSPLTWTLWTQKKNTTTYEVGNPGPGFGQAHQCGGLNRLMRSKPFFICDNQSNNNKINKVMTFTYHLQSLLMSKTIDWPTNINGSIA